MTTRWIERARERGVSCERDRTSHQRRITEHARRFVCDPPAMRLFAFGTSRRGVNSSRVVRDRAPRTQPIGIHPVGPDGRETFGSVSSWLVGWLPSDGWGAVECRASYLDRPVLAGFIPSSACHVACTAGRTRIVGHVGTRLPSLSRWPTANRPRVGDLPRSGRRPVGSIEVRTYVETTAVLYVVWVPVYIGVRKSPPVDLSSVLE